MMFERFQASFPPDDGATIPALSSLGSDPVQTFRAAFGGRSYRGGLYRIVAESDAGAWSDRVRAAFPSLDPGIACFGYDWLGRAFVLDPQRHEGNELGVLLLEPGTGEALEIPCGLVGFHESMIFDEPEATLAASGYNDWRGNGGGAPSLTQCVGYKKPLFLGGDEDDDNLALTDIDVYWTIAAQLLERLRGVAVGTPVRISLGE